MALHILSTLSQMGDRIGALIAVRSGWSRGRRGRREEQFQLDIKMHLWGRRNITIFGQAAAAAALQRYQS